MESQKLTVICPHCQNQIPLDDVLTHQIEEKIKLTYDAKHQKEILEVTKKIQAELDLKVKEKTDLNLKNYQEELVESKVQNKRLLNELSETNKLIRDLKRKDEERQFEMDKKLMAAEDKIRIDATKKATEEQHLKLLEKDKQLLNALKETEELKRKLQQGSQQNQGEVLELELEKMLNREFPNDKISAVEKGIRGADLIQEVWDRTGIKCGVILWETKNAKWSDGWIDKLKEDQRQIKAETAVIICENLPTDIKSAAFRNCVWIADRKFIIGIAMTLRANLIQASFIKRSFQGKNEKKEILWNYLTSSDFAHRMEAVFESFKLMQEDLEREKRVTLKNWAKKEMQLKRMIENTYGLRGDLEGVMGNALPEIKQLEFTSTYELEV